MSYTYVGEYSGLGRLSAVPGADKYICGTENGEIVTVDGHGEAEAIEASEDPITGAVCVNKDLDRCAMVIEDGVSVCEYPDVKTVVEKSTGRRTLPVSHTEFSANGSKMYVSALFLKCAWRGMINFHPERLFDAQRHSHYPSLFKL
jgi:hypothetical protein